MYSCDICDYVTNRNENLKRHNQSVKHSKMIEVELEKTCKENQKLTKKVNEFVCNGCNKNFTTKFNFKRHCQNICTEYQNLSFQNINESLSYYKNNTIAPQMILPKKPSKLNWIINNYPNAPSMDALKNDDILKFIISSQSTARNIILNYNNNEICVFVGTIIINEFKKNNPRKQSFWTSNVSKLCFIIRQHISNKNAWIYDINGSIIIENIIVPILNELKNILEIFVKQNKNNIIEKITTILHSSTMKNDILEYIAPKFELPEIFDNC